MFLVLSRVPAAVAIRWERSLRAPRREGDMKNRIFMTLLFSVVALPAFAQQTNSNSSAQPATAAAQSASASPSATAAGKEPLQRPSPQDFWDGDEPSFGARIFHPCAT